MLNLGGGFPVPYYENNAVPTINEFATPIISHLQPLVSALQFVIEPGRYLAADTGALILTVEYGKDVNGHRVLVVDAGINVLMRPALYDAYHRIAPLANLPDPAIQVPTTIVGPICESTDVFARDRCLPPLVPGDCLAILDTGAYGFSMASNYNSQLRPPEVLVDGDAFHLIRRRETFDDLVLCESLSDVRP